MNPTAGRIFALAVAALLIFGVVVAIGLRLLPEPHGDTDYLVVGSIATFLTLGGVFAVLLSTWLKTPEAFFKHRRKAPGRSGPDNQD